ncbi:MAG: acetyl-CoA acetyltransferase [Dehalococcoidia bacterium]|nr:acetyl-CoA acetyltransferase [Dehalococcoidia bacterium]
MSAFTDQAAIVGIGYTKFSQSAGVSNLSLAAEAALNAIQDAGLKTKQIHSVASYTRGDTPNQGVLETILGLEQLYWNWDATPGAAYCADELIGMAAAACMQNLGDYAIVFHVVNRWANRNPMIGLQGLDSDALWEEGQYGWPYGMNAGIHRSAMMARRRMIKYGTKQEDFGRVVMAARNNACLNDRALLRTHVSLNDYLVSPLVADPLRSLDCFVEAVGACAVIVTSVERAKDLPQPPVYIMAAQSGNTDRPSLGYMTSELGDCFSKRLGKRLYEQAGISPKDVDVAELHDPFSWMVLPQLEDFGFCKEGEAGDFVKNGAIELGGKLPVNTHGGSLAEGEMEGLAQVVEAVIQLRGEAGPRQVKGAEVALCTSHEFDRGSALILRR